MNYNDVNVQPRHLLLHVQYSVHLYLYVLMRKGRQYFRTIFLHKQLEAMLILVTHFHSQLVLHARMHHHPGHPREMSE